jgi:hypothetical protein
LGCPPTGAGSAAFGGVKLFHWFLTMHIIMRLTSSNSPSSHATLCSPQGMENIILSEISQVQKAKVQMFSLICGIQTQYKYKQYYEKQVMLRGSH